MLRPHRRAHLRAWLALACVLPLLLILALSTDRALPVEAEHPGIDPREPLRPAGAAGQEGRQ